tara:strand:- start:1988 stop:2293 length:306 start_codon:yes stop_codon:yes gene_type:complete
MKRDRTQNKAHLQRISEYRCCIWDLSCDGMTQVHHLLKPWSGQRGMGMRSDDKNVIPLCSFHHHQLHNKYGNEEKFFQAHFKPADFGRVLAQELWESYNNP